MSDEKGWFMVRKGKIVGPWGGCGGKGDVAPLRRVVYGVGLDPVSYTITFRNEYWGAIEIVWFWLHNGTRWTGLRVDESGAGVSGGAGRANRAERQGFDSPSNFSLQYNIRNRSTRFRLGIESLPDVFPAYGMMNTYIYENGRRLSNSVKAINAAAELLGQGGDEEICESRNVLVRFPPSSPIRIRSFSLYRGLKFAR